MGPPSMQMQDTSYKMQGKTANILSLYLDTCSLYLIFRHKKTKWGNHMPYCTPQPAKAASLRSVVDALSQLLPGFEMGNKFVRHLNRRASLGIAASTRRTIMEGKAPKTGDFNAVAGRQGGGHLLQELLDRQLHVTVI